MAEKPTQEQIDQWHRWFAVECNNRAWDLIDKETRSPEEDREMLYLAYAAAYHWSKVGKPVNDARADVTLAHAHALLGQGEPALEYARRSLAFFEGREGEERPGQDWDLAFAHAEMARAAATLGDSELHARHYQLAEQLGQAIQEAEDRQVFMAEFARIPKSVLSR